MTAPLPGSNFEGCRVVVLSESGDVLFDDDDCDLRVEPTQLVVSYWDDLGAVVFSGRADDNGLYDLWCRSRPRRAELRYEQGDRAFEGTWREEDQCGSWRIALPAGGPGD